MHLHKLCIVVAIRVLCWTLDVVIAASLSYLFINISINSSYWTIETVIKLPIPLDSPVLLTAHTHTHYPSTYSPTHQSIHLTTYPFMHSPIHLPIHPPSCLSTGTSIHKKCYLIITAISGSCLPGHWLGRVPARNWWWCMWYLWTGWWQSRRCMQHLAR